ncbi:MAG TPA: lytic murein transglycosylase [Candidatus Paceibacterota bacterium]|jgi:peptidoglycan hydrolase CwlO-like protein|nr:lytic murein transglycosylase [Candidatus Paceibacterota bacterium]HRU20994.1 lytic murein transglycosylase [Candidatus Paceibacterota bacterium]
MQFRIFNKLNQKLFLSLLIAGIFLPAIFAHAYDLNTICDSGEWQTECDKLSQEECQNLCNQCLQYFNEQSAKIQNDLNQTGAAKKTLQAQINSINKKIKDLDYQIKQSQLSIKSLGFQINDTEQSITKTMADIEAQKKKMAEILRTVQTEDKKSFVEIMVTSETLSDFFDNLLYLETLDAKNNEVLANYIDLQKSLESKKTNLEQETTELQNLVIVQSMQKNTSAQTKQEREYYLGLTEAQYQAQLKEKEDIEKKAAEISKRLFELIGVQNNGIEFGEAAQLARQIETQTGVRAAFLLAIIHTESFRNGVFGGNVGQCYVTNFNTGSGTDLKGNPKIRVMNPTRDVPLFIKIVQKLGLEPDKTPVSCWIPMYSKGVPYGWGGAMGPAQFIPSTWNVYTDKISAITGKPANPWSIKDAFLGAALLLKDNGALTDERSAACRYYAGSCSSAGLGYAKQVLAQAAQYQQDLDVLKKAGE